MTIDHVITALHLAGGAAFFALAAYWALRVEWQAAEIQRLRRRIDLHQADARDQQAELRRVYDRKWA